MFNLIMLGAMVDWRTGIQTIPAARILEFTSTAIGSQFRQSGNLLLDQLANLPCLFMVEGTGDEIAYVGKINRTRMAGNDVVFEYVIDTEIPPLHNKIIYANRTKLDASHPFEFSRNHWAVKDVDLYRFLYQNVPLRRQRPTVFQLPDHESIEPTLASAMMPFGATFDSVYESIRKAAGHEGLQCKRADDIWENASIIQDIVSLIDRSRIVVCDCTGRNPNVFYEVGIAHALGREVILITQSEHDIPFDLRHLRYILYLNNAEGRTALTASLQARIQTILRNS